uniref:hypothetical protein n=1 Tax=Yersinia frederiksenii TaxID=29484 RepID=UPI001F4C504C|nr:hypothetical protein [Yersinia frederiksenii]ULG19802.1 hypothetical protein 49p1_00085 [Yersinia frederiksenii]
MKKVLIATLLSLFVQTVWATEDKCIAKSVFTFPMQSYENYVFIPRRACLKGKDVTNCLTGGDILTSLVKVNGAELFYITTRNNKDSYFQLIAVFQLENGRAFKRTILQNNPNRETTPENSLQNMVVNHYNENISTLYFSTKAWAQSDAIHIIKFSNISSIKPIYEKFLTDGNFVGSKGDSILVQKINHNNKEGYLKVVEINSKGEQVCQINTQEEQWKFSPHCLRSDEIIKDR